MSDPSSDYADTEQHEVELDDAVTWGRNSDQQQKLEMFSTVTGADHATAEHVLDAHGWNMDRSVTFFLESGGVGHAGAPTAQRMGGTSAAAASRSAQAGPAAHRVEDPAELVDLSAIPGTSPHDGAAPPSHTQVNALDGEDAALQRALAESMQTAGGGSRHQSARAAALASSPIQMDLGEEDEDAFMTPDEEDDLEVLQRQRESAQASASRAAVQADEWSSRPRARSQAQGSAGQRTADDLQAMGQRMGINIPPAMAAGMAGGSVAAMGPAAAAAFRHARGGANGAMDRPDSMELPEGINLEEARMLEAAMLGIPYAGRIPNFAAEASAAETISSPQAQAGRVVRQEQDAAYEESLRADRQKQAAAEQAARAAREAEEAVTRQLAEAAASAAAQQQRLEQMLQRKRQGLPDEPDAADPEAVEIQVRLPGGSRMRRRFRRTNPLASLFDYIDLHSEGHDIQPGSYSLVTQFPRRRYRESTPGSLSSSGLVTAKQEAVLLERD